MKEYFFYLTNNCNLNCKYCFENKFNEKNCGESKIDFNIIEKIVKERANDKYGKTIIGFFGGEPMLHKDIIEKTVNLCNELQKTHEHKFAYTITTNATMIDEKFAEFFKNENINVGISIDGIKEVHDLNRVDYSENGSFDVACQGAKYCIDKNVTCAAMVTVTINNVNMLSESVEFLVDFGFKKIILNLNYEDPWNDEYISILKSEYEKISEYYYDCFSKKKFFVLMPLDNKIRSYIKSLECTDGCSMDRIVVSVDGTYFPCTQYVYKKEYSIGNYNDGLDFKKQYKIFHKRIDSEVPCVKCALKTRCIYKCGCTRISTTGDIVDVSPIVCESERIYIDIADRLAERLNKDFNKDFLKFFVS